MADLMLRNIPDHIVKSYEAQATAYGETLEAYVGGVLNGKRPVASVPTANRMLLVEMTRRNLARFERPLEPMARGEFREGLEE